MKLKHKAPPGPKLKIAFLMDPMEKLLLKFDTSLAIMMEAQNRGHQIYYIEPREIVYQNGSLFVNAAREVIASDPRIQSQDSGSFRHDLSLSEELEAYPEPDPKRGRRGRDPPDLEGQRQNQPFDLRLWILG